MHALRLLLALSGLVVAKYDNTQAAAAFNKTATTLSGQFYLTNVGTKDAIQSDGSFEFWPASTGSKIWITPQNGSNYVVISPDKQKCLSAAWSDDQGADWVGSFFGLRAI
jgi:hypothetical protein